MGLYTGKIGVTSKEYFGTYVYKPFASELGNKEKKWIIPTSIILGFMSFGLVQLICYAAFSRKKISLLNRHMEYHAVSTRVKFLIERLNLFPENEKTKVALKREFKSRIEEIETGSSTKMLQEHLLYLQCIGGEKLFNEIGKEADDYLHPKVNQVPYNKDEKIRPANKEDKKVHNISKNSKTIDSVQEAKEENDIAVKAALIEKLKNCERQCLKKGASIFYDVCDLTDAFEALYKKAPEIFENNREILQNAILKFLKSLTAGQEDSSFAKKVDLAWACYLDDQKKWDELEQVLPKLNQIFSEQSLEKFRQECFESFNKNRQK